MTEIARSPLFFFFVRDIRNEHNGRVSGVERSNMIKLDAKTYEETMEIVNEERLKLFEELDSHDPHGDAYEAVMARLKDLQQVEESLAKQNLDLEKAQLERDKVLLEYSGRPLSKDTAVASATTIVGILLVIGYELFGEGILTSKAFSLIPKFRVG